MDSGYDDVAFPHQVTPFGYPRVLARLQLSEAFRSLLRPSSPVGTKAFTISPWVPLSNPGDSLLKFFVTCEVLPLQVSRTIRANPLCMLDSCVCSTYLEIVFSHKIVGVLIISD